jgi:hypothetical protein
LGAHWGVPDPAAAGGTEAELRAAFAEAYRVLEDRILLFTTGALKSMDKGTLQKRLDEIGKSA